METFTRPLKSTLYSVLQKTVKYKMGILSP